MSTSIATADPLLRSSYLVSREAWSAGL